MGEIRRPGCGCDPCANDWKLKIRELWERYQGTIRTIMMGGRAYHPDGDGKVTLPLPEIAGGIMLSDMTDYWTMTVTDDEDIQLTDNVTYWTLEVTYE